MIWAYYISRHLNVYKLYWFTYYGGRRENEIGTEVSVSLKNIGNATASNINLAVDNPPELQAIALLL